MSRRWIAVVSLVVLLVAVATTAVLIKNRGNETQASGSQSARINIDIDCITVHHNSAAATVVLSPNTGINITLGSHLKGSRFVIDAKEGRPLAKGDGSNAMQVQIPLQLPAIFTNQEIYSASGSKVHNC